MSVIKKGESVIKVAIVEDDASVRQGLSGMLKRMSGFECVGMCASGEDAVADLPQKQPQVVLMDIDLPGMRGIECVKELSRILTDAQFIMLTVYHDTNSIFNALAAGAGGYLLKPVSAKELEDALRDVYAGGAPMTSSIARKVVQFFNERARPESPDDNLTPREKEILEYLAQGYLYKEISDKLNVSYDTVHTHIKRIYHKMHVHSRSQAIARYLGK